MKFNSRGIAVTAAALALAGITTACGGGSSSAASCAEANAEITKVVSAFSSETAKMATDPDAFNTAAQKMATDLKGVAGKYDGDLASAVNDLAAVYEGLKIDAADPTKMTASLADIGTKSQEIQAKMTKACA